MLGIGSPQWLFMNEIDKRKRLDKFIDDLILEQMDSHNGVAISEREILTRMYQANIEINDDTVNYIMKNFYGQ